MKASELRDIPNGVWKNFQAHSSMNEPYQAHKDSKLRDLFSKIIDILRPGENIERFYNNGGQILMLLSDGDVVGCSLGRPDIRRELPIGDDAR